MKSLNQSGMRVRFYNRNVSSNFWNVVCNQFTFINSFLPDRLNIPVIRDDELLTELSKSSLLYGRRMPSVVDALLFLLFTSGCENAGNFNEPSLLSNFKELSLFVMLGA